jgi:hypothetical protein
VLMEQSYITTVNAIQMLVVPATYVSWLQAARLLKVSHQKEEQALHLNKNVQFSESSEDSDDSDRMKLRSGRRI